jgi:Asp-tRNA(Asn)/Glu-tRNA(Gln) amidotransferase A subunit family amidase
MTKTVCDGAEKYWSAEGILPKTYKEFSPSKGQKLKFGYYIQDNFVYTSPACERAVLETVEALRGAGHEVIEVIMSV